MKQDTTTFGAWPILVAKICDVLALLASLKRRGAACGTVCSAMSADAGGYGHGYGHGGLGVIGLMPIVIVVLMLRGRI